METRFCPGRWPFLPVLVVRGNRRADNLPDWAHPDCRYRRVLANPADFARHDHRLLCVAGLLWTGRKYLYVPRVAAAKRRAPAAARCRWIFFPEHDATPARHRTG